jgi:hypothetical protein
MDSTKASAYFLWLNEVGNGPIGSRASKAYRFIVSVKYNDFVSYK